MFAFVHQNIEWSIPRVYKQRYGFLAIFDPPPTCHDPSHLLSKSDSHVNCLSPEKVLNIAENRIVIYTYKSQRLCIYVYSIISKTIIDRNI